MPGPTVARLPVYHRALAAMADRRRETVSSAELAAEVGVNPATLRRDLSHLGSYGTRGTGYEVAQLLDRVDRALAIDREWPVVIVGAGNLGRALARSGNFSARGLRVAALVDSDPAVVGDRVGELVVEHLDQLEAAIAREASAIAVLATPASAAQEVTDRLVAAGVRAILNLAPAVLQAPSRVRLGTVDLAAELQVLAFYGARTDQVRALSEPPGRAAGDGRRTASTGRAVGGGQHSSRREPSPGGGR